MSDDMQTTTQREPAAAGRPGDVSVDDDGLWLAADFEHGYVLGRVRHEVPDAQLIDSLPAHPGHDETAGDRPFVIFWRDPQSRLHNHHVDEHIAAALFAPRDLETAITEGRQEAERIEAADVAEHAAAERGLDPGHG